MWKILYDMHLGLIKLYNRGEVGGGGWGRVVGRLGLILHLKIMQVSLVPYIRIPIQYMNASTL